MEVLRGIDARTDGGPTVVTIGTFDGVHQGHASLHERVLRAAERLEARPAVVIFDPHPLEVIAPERAPCLLTTVDQRIALFEREGMEVVLVLPFDRDLQALEPDDFVQRVLLGALRARKVVVGADFHFGHDRAGDASTLERVGVETEVVELVARNGGKISSSDIRRAVSAGDMEEAARLLGHPFRLAGTVVVGARRGRTIGFPTANVQPHPKACLPALGVYAGWWLWGDERRAGVINVGVRPTFSSDDPPVVEVHVFDLDADLYGEAGEVEFASRLRAEKRFASADDLVAQIRADAAEARALLAAR